MTLTVRAACDQAQAKLAEILQLEVSEARLEAQLLLQTAANVDRAWLIAHAQDAIDPTVQQTLQALLTRRLQGEPVAYILGHREFYGLNLSVTPDTLIPRPDTETLVETALSRLPAGCKKSVLDLGTGTGAIALAIAAHRPELRVTAVDASAKALKIARQNALTLDISNATFLQSDWFSALQDQQFDLIVSNPPYIAEQDAHLAQLKFEPISALTSGPDGLDDIRRIIADCLIHLKPQAWLMLEHGYDQAEAVQDLMAEIGLIDIQTLQDLGGNDRVTLGKNPLIVSTHWG